MTDEIIRNIDTISVKQLAAYMVQINQKIENIQSQNVTILNELKDFKQTVTQNLDSVDKRVSKLEGFRNQLLGIGKAAAFIVGGGGLLYFLHTLYSLIH